MKKTTVLALALAAGCGGGKADDAKNVAAAVGAAASGQVQEAVDNAEKFRQERIARGDTVAMEYAALQGYLPERIEGLEPTGGPKGQRQAMAGFSMAQAERTWAAAGQEGVTPEVSVAIVDFGGTQQGYAMLAAPLFMGFSREDDHEKVGSVKVDLANSGAWEEFDKDNKNAKFTVVTQYRYVITVQARGFGEDKSALAKSVALDVAAKFKGK